MSSGLIFAYATVPDPETAERLARVLIEERLIACANLFPGMTSIYRWEGTIENASEVALILKTRAELWPRLSARFRELHPYQTPCLIEIPVARGLEKYVQWLKDETGDHGPDDR